MGLFISLLVLLLLSATALPSIYLKVKPGVPNCFHNDVSSGILTQITYKLEPIVDKAKKKPIDKKDLSIKVVIYDPQNEVQLSRVYKNHGQVHYTSTLPGIHKTCIEPYFSDEKAAQTMKIHLDIKTVGSQNYTEVAIKEKLSDLQLKLRHTQDQMRLIVSRQRYADNRERRFRKTTDAISEKVLLFGLLHVLTLLTIGYCQLRSLRKFFIAKKLV